MKQAELNSLLPFPPGKNMDQRIADPETKKYPARLMFIQNDHHERGTAFTTIFRSKIMRCWSLKTLLIGAMWLPSCGQEEVPVFEDEAAFLDSFPSLEDGPLRAADSSVGVEPRQRFELLHSPGEYEVYISNSSINSLVGTAEAVKKRKEYWYRLTVLEPDAAGALVYRLQGTRNRYHKIVESEVFHHYVLFDSEEGGLKSGDSEFDELMMAQAQQEFWLRVTKDGQITDAPPAGLDDSLSKIPEGLANLAKLFSSNQAYQVEVVFPQRSYLPAAPVGQGAIWYPTGHKELGPMQEDYQVRCWFQSEQEFGFYRVASTQLTPLGEDALSMNNTELALRIQLQFNPETVTTSQGTFQFMPTGGLQRMESYEESRLGGENPLTVKRKKLIAITRLQSVADRQ